MERFTYSVAGKSATIDYSGAYLIDNYSGLSGADIEPITYKGYGQNGYTMGGLTLGQRTINIDFYITAANADSYYARRQEICSLFNPLNGAGVLTYQNNHTAKSITCIPTQPLTIERMGLMAKCSIELTAYNPFWYDVAETAVALAGFIGGLKFPMKFDDTVSFAVKGNTANVDIVGDVASPIRAVFHDNAVKPKLTLQNTGEFIEIDTTIQTGEKMTITTAYGQKNVIITKANGTSESAYHLINLNSTFFSLPVGRNNISFSATSGEPLVELYYRNYYVGV